MISLILVSGVAAMRRSASSVMVNSSRLRIDTSTILVHRFMRQRRRCDVDGCGDHRLADGSDLFLDCHSRSEEHTSELQSLMRISYAVFCLKKTNYKNHNKND